MKLSIYILSTLILLLNSACGNSGDSSLKSGATVKLKEKSDLEKHHLHGPIKQASVSGAIFMTRNGKLYQDLILIEEKLYFHKNGRLRKFVKYRSAYLFYWSNDYTYSQDWLIKTVKNINTFRKLSYTIQYSKKTNRQIQKTSRYDADNKFVSQTMYDYDTYGNILKQKIILSSKKEGKTTVFKRYKNGRIKTVLILNNKQKLTHKETFVYNKAGHVTEKKVFHGSGDLLNHERYSYNKHGNLKELKKYRGKVLASRYVYQYKYDTKKNWIKKLELMEHPVNGKMKLDPHKAFYRVIHYY